MPTREQLENLLRDPEFRREFIGDYVQEVLAAQIRANRDSRGWSQEQLGQAADGMSQVQISRLENPQYSGTTLRSLKRLVQAYDAALIVSIVSFKEFLDWFERRKPENIAVPSYDEEQQQADQVQRQQADAQRRKQCN